MAESSGELLGGRFRLLGERAAFPFGSWWEAEDEQGARTLVLRMSGDVAEPAAKATQAMAQSASIDSPHVVPWADGGVDAEGQGWLAAPMFGPWSLTEHVTRGEGIPPTEAGPIMHQLARGLAAAEAVNVHHLTLASELVRLLPLPEGGHGVKIYGYGLSDLLPSYKPLRKQDAYLGVPDYMSPELCAGKAAEGSSADIYAAGVLMYEAVRGRPPFAPTFASASASTTLKRHIFEKPLALSVRYANAPFIKSYEAVCFKALAKTSNRRQLTLAELERELEQLVVDEMRQQVVNLGAMSSRGPTTARRLRTQVLQQVPTDDAGHVTAVAAPVVEEKAPVTAAAPKPVEKVPEEKPAPVQKAIEPEPAKAAEPAATVATGEAELAAVGLPRRSESTLVFAGLGPAVREMAEAARKDNEEEEEGDEGETTPEPQSAVSPNQNRGGGGGGKRGKKKKSQSHMQAATASIARPEPSKLDTTEKAAQPASTTSGAEAARVRRRDDKTVVTPDTGAALPSVEIAKDKPAVVAKATDKSDKPDKIDKKVDEQEDWFASTGVGDSGRKKNNKAWIYVAVAAAIVLIVVIILATTGGSKTASNTVPAAVPPTRYALPQQVPEDPRGEPVKTAEAKPAEPTLAPVEAKPAEPTPAPVEAKPAEPAPVEAKPAEPAPIEAKPTTTAAVTPTPAPVEVKPTTKPVETKPATTAAVKPVETKPVETKPAETKPATTTALKPVETKPAEAKPAEAKPAETKPVEAKPAETAEVEPKPATPSSPEDAFREQAKHYITQGLKAYKSENYKLAAGYFQKAQEADSSNALAGKYLQMAREKMAQQ